MSRTLAGPTILSGLPNCFLAGYDSPMRIPRATAIIRLVTLVLLFAISGCGSVNGGKTQRRVQPMDRNEPMMTTKYLQNKN
jgi:hypothetical protein